jgi:hypothetical protein
MPGIESRTSDSVAWISGHSTAEVVTNKIINKELYPRRKNSSLMCVGYLGIKKLLETLL